MNFFVPMFKTRSWKFPHRSLPATLICTAVALLFVTDKRILSDDAGTEFFEKSIRPVLVEHCYECHSSATDAIKGGLWLDSRRGLLDGGDSGPAIDLKNPSGSLLIAALKHTELKMPPARRLSDSIISDFEKWIAMGAPDTRNDDRKTPAKASIDYERAKQHWAFQPRRFVTPPVIADRPALSPIDAFVSAKRIEAGIAPAPMASSATWIRRVYIDLVGIVPTPEEVSSFIEDESLDAREKVIDQLLASPRYAERWGRHWLDLARYADSNGADENHRYPVAWRYRDYVVDALNQDKPFDQFIVEQLAGDLLDSPNEKDRREKLTATGFLVLGPKMLAEQDKPKLVTDIVDEQVDSIGKAFLGLTFGCARCHDHKFDPISTKDYYALAGIFHSTRSMEHLNHVAQWNERELPNTELSASIEAHERELSRVRSDFQSKRRELLKAEFDRQLAEFEKQLRNLQSAPTDVPSRNDPRWVWHRWSTIPLESYETESKQLWTELQSPQATEPQWYQRLTSYPAPKSQDELWHNYSQTLTKAWEEIVAAEKKPDGQLTAESLRPINQLLFEKGKPFSIIDPAENLPAGTTKDEYIAQKGILERLEKTKPVIQKAMAVDEGAVKEVPVHIRGNHLVLSGDPVIRDVPYVLRDKESSLDSKIPEKSSGRLQLAKWIASDNNPLTARVIANRVWQHHFGAGIVGTPSNFGLKGEEPSHPELLDWLANFLVDHDWSLKALHREILLSETYGLSTKSDAQNESVDPSNRLLWRQNRQRLEIEALRDSLLAMAEVLDNRIGGESINAGVAAPNVNEGIDRLGPLRRTLYLEINRAAMADFLTSFDYVEPGVSVEKRTATVVPHQVLFLMNHPLPMEAGRRIALLSHSSTSTDAERLDRATMILFGRSANALERATLGAYLTKKSSHDPSVTIDIRNSNSPVHTWVGVCRALLLTNEFLYVE